MEETKQSFECLVESKQTKRARDETAWSPVTGPNVRTQTINENAKAPPQTGKNLQLSKALRT